MQFLFLTGAAVFNFLIYKGGRLLAADREHKCMSLPWEAQIPFLPWTVLIYWGCCIFWVLNYYLGMRYDKGSGYRFITAHFIGEAICFLFFVMCPTTMVRPDIPGAGFGEQILRLTYQWDAADNLFPSIHCFVSWLCWIGVRDNENVSIGYQFFSLCMAVSVCISTLTVKQHVLADVFAGVLLAEISYLMASALEERRLRILNNLKMS